MKKKEVGEIKEGKEVKENGGDVAAFFDLDGTLLPAPSLENSLWGTLRYRKSIGVRNYLAWLREAMRLLPRGIAQIANGNKAYLRGVRAAEAEALAIPAFFPEAVWRVSWHVERGHRIVIVSGTLEPLAWRAARLLAAELATRGLTARVDVFATQLETAARVCTGRILGEAMFGEAKARAMRRFCMSRGIALERCFAYGDSANDRWMLEAVGRPTAVNPADDLARMAQRSGWPVLWWGEEKIFTQSSRSAQRPLCSWSAQMSFNEVQIAATKRECWR